MMNTPTGNKDSSNILHLIPKNSIGAEVGVWEGYTSEKLLTRNPKLLYLIDPWSTSGYDEPIKQNDSTFSVDNYYKRYQKLAGGANTNSFNNYYDNVHSRVCKKFENLDNVKICRTTSSNWFETYNKDKLDWIYIDGDHSYIGVMNDLLGAMTVVKKGGIIIGDDYKWDSEKDKGGVKKAVNEFARKFNYDVKRYGLYQFGMVL
jgi:hypothetical protein